MIKRPAFARTAKKKLKNVMEAKAAPAKGFFPKYATTPPKFTTVLYVSISINIRTIKQATEKNKPKKILNGFIIISIYLLFVYVCKDIKIYSYHQTKHKEIFIFNVH